MKFIFWVNLSLVLANFNTSSNAVRAAEELKKIDEGDLQRNFINSNVDGVIILDHLDFAELLNVSQINNNLSILAADVFRRKYSHLELKFEVRDNGENNRPPIVTETYILLEGSDILNTFKHFGHVIKKLTSISYYDRPSNVELIGQLINEYSSESLVEVHIQQNADKILAQITKPLINVENVTLENSHLRENIQIIRPDILFPVLRRLNMISMTKSSFDFFNCHIPNLEHISMNRIRHDNSPSLDFIEKNPQIRSIDVTDAEPNFLKQLNILLPQLEIFKLFRFKLPNGNIQFENVTTFYIEYGFYTSIQNLHFPRLRTLHMDYDPDRFDEYLTFVNEHNRLNKLHLVHDRMDDSEFQRFTANLRDLVELTVERSENPFKIRTLSHEAIVECLRSHGNVKRFNVINYPKIWGVLLQEQLQQDWTPEINGAGLTFKRKTNS